MRLWMIKMRMICAVAALMGAMASAHAQDQTAAPAPSHAAPVEATAAPQEPQPTAVPEQQTQVQAAASVPVSAESAPMIKVGSAIKADQYYTPTLERMIDFLFSIGYIDPMNPRQLIDYVRVKDCNLLMKYYKDDFTWNKIRNRIVVESKALQKDVATRFVVSDVLSVDRYNFDTKAFDINTRSQMRNINSINVMSGNQQTECEQFKREQGIVPSLPYRFDVKLDIPISLYRIPMAESMARYILPELSQRKMSGELTRNVYILIYFTVDGVASMTNLGALLNGHVDKIEFFLDADHLQRFKRLVYNQE